MSEGLIIKGSVKMSMINYNSETYSHKLLFKNRVCS